MFQNSFHFLCIPAQKKVRAVASFYPHWVVWIHTGVAKYAIKKGLHIPCLRSAGGIWSKLNTCRSPKLTFQTMLIEKKLTLWFELNGSKLGTKPLCPPEVYLKDDVTFPQAAAQTAWALSSLPGLSTALICLYGLTMAACLVCIVILIVVIIIIGTTPTPIFTKKS